MNPIARFILACMLIMTAAGCGSVPMPLTHHTAPNALADDRRVTSAVVIAPVAAYPGLAEAVVGDLARQDILAATRTSATRFVRVQGDMEQGNLVWRLTDPDRHELGVVAQSVPAGAAVPQLAQDAVPLITKLLTGEGAASGNPNRPHVAVGKVRAPPGIDGLSLSRAMADALVAQGITVGTDNVAVTVQGELRLLPGTGNQDMVQMDWTVQDAKGASLGTVSQGSPVDRAALAASFNELARDIATAGAPAVVEVIRKRAPQAISPQR